MRPSTRIAPDGFVLRETIAEYVQVLTVTASELRQDFKVEVPEAIESWRPLRLLGGGTLIFDEYGQLKYQIANHLLRDRGDRKRQGDRLAYLWKQGYLDRKVNKASHFSALHLARNGVRESN
ncbi:hypothetical protein SAMN03159288_05124 [Rhizobium sp. NFACC06-2]|nr:hypothetical protein SAMN03159288_05124 [Rhizobium sp. NFACC06-2]